MGILFSGKDGERTCEDFLSLGLMLVYLLGVRGGYVALWQDEDPEPVAVFPLRRGQPAAGGPGSPFFVELS